MGPTQEALALADFLIAKYGLSTDRYALAYAIMEHEEAAIRAEGASPTPDAAARARELLALELQRSGFNWNPAIRSDSLTDPQEAAVRAIERALTTPSDAGGDVAWPLNPKPGNGWTFDPDFIDEIKTRAEQSDVGEFAPCLEGVESVLIALRDMKAATPPNPGDARLRELAERWREEAGQLLEDHGGDRAAVCVADAMQSMVTELESLLGRGA